MKYERLRDRRLYRVLQDMKSRCYNSKNNNYKNYGGKGIIICDEWNKDYLKFEEWALSNGYDKNAPRGKCTIDRINPNGNYEPNNCRWVDMRTQLYNTSQNAYITANGETLTVMQWANKLGVSFSFLENRRVRGWKDEDIINKPKRSYKKSK